jgi:hypothetical protein
MVPINSSLVTITLYPSVITTLVYNDTNYSVPFMTLTEFDCILIFSLHVSRAGHSEDVSVII